MGKLYSISKQFVGYITALFPVRLEFKYKIDNLYKLIDMYGRALYALMELQDKIRILPEFSFYLPSVFDGTTKHSE